ncbi:MAG: cyclase family protein [Clostridiales Family XIII bacterium]|nr:cyclase family protein [Clostridiales Family XIII bacterium]
MKVIDLTHTISEDMPVFPGTEPPKLDPANTYEKDGFKETLMTMYTHTGTHMDPPAHLFPGRTTLDAFPAEQFVGKAVVIDCTDVPAGGKITMSHIDKVSSDAAAADFLIFNTGWGKYWGQDEYFGDFPVIDDAVADYVKAGGKKGIGVDVISIDPVPDENLTTHRRLFKDNEIVVIENLKDPGRLAGGLFTFIALPLKHKDGDGSPIRAIALLEE